MQKVPCHNCQERTSDCHVYCERYIEYTKQRAEILAAKRAAANAEQDLYALKAAGVKRSMQGKRKLPMGGHRND